MTEDYPIKNDDAASTDRSVLRFAAEVVSVILHPVFIPLYISFFLLYHDPVLFAGFSDLEKFRLLATVFINYTFLPLFVVFLLWRLKFIASVRLNTVKERIIPLAASMVFYFWIWYVIRNRPDIPEGFQDFALANFIAVIAAWIANIYYKISLHAIAAGGSIGIALIMTMTYPGASGFFLSAALLAAGIVCTARLIASNHSGFDIYSGIVVGIGAQYLAVALG
jgi:hypothetical protein